MFDTLYVAGFLLGTGYLLVRSVQGVLDRSFAHVVSVVTGEVMREQKRSETEVSGQISGGGSTRYGGGRVHGTISSKTTRFQEIFLRMPNGKERRLDFQDFNVPCREGNRLSIVRAGRTDGSTPVVGYHNHATNDSVIMEDRLRRALRWPGVGPLAGRWGLFFALLGLATMWDSGDLAETGPVAGALVVVVFGLLAGAVAWVLLYLGAAFTAGGRVGRVRGDIGRKLAAAEE